MKTEDSGRRALLVSKGWVQGVALVLLFGFFGLGFLAFRTRISARPSSAGTSDPGAASP